MGRKQEKKREINGKKRKRHFGNLDTFFSFFFLHRKMKTVLLTAALAAIHFCIEMQKILRHQKSLLLLSYQESHQTNSKQTQKKSPNSLVDHD